VKLTPRGELLLIAPCKKFSQQTAQQSSLDSSLHNQPGYSHHIASDVTQCSNIPLRITTKSRYLQPVSYSTQVGFPFSTFGMKLSGCGLGEWDLPINQTQVQKFVSVLEQIFCPNIVVCSIVPTGKHSTTSTTFSSWKTQQQKQQPQTQPKMQLVVDIKLVDFHPKKEVNVRVHESNPNVLIVEGKREMGAACSLTSTSTCGVKYVRREILVPQWLKVQKVTIRAKEHSVVQISWPFRTTSKSFCNCSLFTWSEEIPCRCSPLGLQIFDGSVQQKQSKYQKASRGGRCFQY
jgi:hypothetical protein